MPSLNHTGWPQLSTTIDDHQAFKANRPGWIIGDLSKLAGKSFKSNQFAPLPPDIRKQIVKMKLATSKKAGTLSNQTAAAATAWLLAFAHRDFRNADMAWSGRDGASFS